MNTDGINNIAIMIGYKYFIFSFDILPIATDKTNVDIIIKDTIPIKSAGPANNGNM